MTVAPVNKVNFLDKHAARLDANIQSYIATARRQHRHEQATLQQLRSQVLAIAQTAAHILREEFGASRVVVFGSVLDETRFHATSDLDLAVWGLPPANYIKALARLMTLSDCAIDLVEAETASPAVLVGIAAGLEL